MNSGLKSQKILVAPLGWGLGHATRCIPIINELISLNCTVWIAAGGDSLQLLRKEFPLLPFLNAEGHHVIYHSAKSDFRYVIARQVPAIIRSIRREHRWLKAIIAEHYFDIVISDNRYGMYYRGAYCVIITHQLGIKTGLGVWADRIVRRLNYRRIRNFDECWIPDFAGKDNLAGALSHPPQLPPRARYIGALSRLEKREKTIKYDLLIILSGPEPRRTMWEKSLLLQLELFEGNVLLVRGLPGNESHITSGSGKEIVNYLSSEALGAAIQQATWVVCRSGYTSVMDLVQLQQKAILVPTPGQTEQEYLAQWLHDNEIFYTCSEDGFSLQQCIREAANFPFRFSNFVPFLAGYKTQIKDLVTRVESNKR